jgi:D-glycero-D-manno-heptose 1,7-bisphosphate phosphatase
MLIAAAQECGIALQRSFMIGDRASDVAAGLAAGCRTIFIDLEYSNEPKPRCFAYRASSIVEAAKIILCDDA